MRELCNSACDGNGPSDFSADGAGLDVAFESPYFGSMNVVSDHQAICIFSPEETTAIELVILLHLYD